jgi:hypothetical protein
MSLYHCFVLHSGVSPHLRTETDPVSETSCFSSNYLESGRWTKSENPVILYDNEHSGSIICCKISEQLSNWWLFKKGSAPWG